MIGLQTSSYQTPRLSPLPNSPFAETADAYYNMDQHMAKSLPPPPFSNLSPPADSGPAHRSSEEPMEAEKDQMVIDLTPDGVSRVSGHHQGRNTPSMPAVTGEFQTNLMPAQTSAANIPCLLQQPVISSCSDSETASQDAAITGAMDIVTGTFRFSLPKNGVMTVAQPRAKREFVPDNKKDQSYWDKRQKNNASARMSRYKRKAMQSLLEQNVVKLQKENQSLRCELKKLKEMFADQLPEDFGSPVSSPSSGLTASTSSLSSAGSADRSSSSSPNLTTDNSRMSSLHSTDRPPSHSDEEVEQVRDSKTQAKENLDQQAHFSFPPSVASVPPPPPPAHSNKKSSTYSNGFPAALCGHRAASEVTPPLAHSSYCGPAAYNNNNNNNNAHSSLFPSVKYPAMQSWCNNMNAADWRMFRDSASAAAAAVAATFPHPKQMLSQKYASNYSSSPSSHSPGPSNSPTGMTVSEDDSNISTDLHRKSSSSSDQDEDSQQMMRRVPLKWRFKANIKDVCSL